MRYRFTGSISFQGEKYDANANENMTKKILHFFEKKTRFKKYNSHLYRNICCDEIVHQMQIYLAGLTQLIYKLIDTIRAL